MNYNDAMLTTNKRTPKLLISSTVHLLSLPSLYTRLEETLKDPNHTREDIAKVVSIDTALCSRILRVVNSSYYGLPNSVDSISTAVNLIGKYDLRNMVLVNSVVNSVASLVDGGIDIHEFWRHSIRSGIIAKLLAKQQTVEDSELLFLCGLLHDLGQLIIYKQEHELSNTISRLVTNEERKRYQVEQELLGFDHALVGSLLAESWGLPTKIKEIIKNHHQPDQSTPHYKEAKLVDLADQLAHFLVLNDTGADIVIDQLPDSINNYLVDLNIDNAGLLKILSEAIKQSQAIEEMVCEI